MRDTPAIPRGHLILACLLGAIMVAALLLPSEPSQARKTFSLEPRLLEAGTVPAPDPAPRPASDGVPDDAVAAQQAPPEPAEEWRTIAVKSGESLARIFKREHIPAADLYHLQHSSEFGGKLAHIYPGHKIGLLKSDTGVLMGLRYAPDPLRTFEFRRMPDDTFSGEVLAREPERRLRYAEGTIEHSLFLASQRADLDDAITMRLAGIFQWDIDFVLDIRAGDRFAVLFEELYLDGEKIGNGDILAAEFINRGQVHQAVSFTDSQGVKSFYTPDGRSMRKAFLRAPVEFSRISSNFNLHRVHPLYKRVMPHRGIDYAAPPGTPVLAAGDGKVLIATRHNANGNYIVLQHGEQYRTKYLHLSRFARGIRRGARVRQGQVIGYVGSTGWATGPHLHYEFLVNGVHRNPRTVKLPQATPVARVDRAAFEEHSTRLLAQLEAARTLQVAHLDNQD